jgi:hypothetical protein
MFWLSQINQVSTVWCLSVDSDSDTDRAVKNAINRWLVDCHEKHDREVIVEDIIDSREVNGEVIHRFRKMTYGKGQNYKIGDKMKFTRNKPYRFGTIKYFSCKGILKDAPLTSEGQVNNKASQKKVTGTATIHYQRYPDEYFGSGLLQEPVTLKLGLALDGMYVCMYACMYACMYLYTYV